MAEINDKHNLCTKKGGHIWGYEMFVFIVVNRIKIIKIMKKEMIYGKTQYNLA